MGRRYWIAVVFVVLLGHSCLTVCSDLTPGWQDHPGSALVLSCCWSALACCCWDHDMATPPPQRSVFSLLLRQLDAESLLGGGVQREGLGMFPGSSRFLERRLEGGSMARAGGLGGLYGLSVDTGPLVRGRPPLSLWSSLTAVASKAPSRRPSAPFILCSAGPRLHRRNGQAWLGFLLPSPPTGTGRLREGQDRDKQRGRDPETWRDPSAGRRRQQTGTDVPAQRRAVLGRGLRWREAGGW